ncbi:hypothetical protein [Sphingobacterium mizutaii]|uniref:hypothetical protein n=1 Tax=Sphingobacterium mizutaii TaxID=1010 RepID=UPI003D9A0143
MSKYKVKDFVKHKWFGKDITLQVINISIYPGREDSPIYLCRYFANGKFHSEDFYEHELKDADN